jgi:hypothetical protein
MKGTQPVCKYSNPAQNKIWIHNIPNKLSYELIIFSAQLLSLIKLKIKFIVIQLVYLCLFVMLKNVYLFLLFRANVGSNLCSLEASPIGGHYAW